MCVCGMFLLLCSYNLRYRSKGARTEGKRGKEMITVGLLCVFGYFMYGMGGLVIVHKRSFSGDLESIIYRSFNDINEIFREPLFVKL